MFAPGGCSKCLSLLASPISDPYGSPAVVIWSSCLETTRRCNTDLESALRGTPTSLAELMVHDQMPVFAATSFGGLGFACMEWFGGMIGNQALPDV